MKIFIKRIFLFLFLTKSAYCAFGQSDSIVYFFDRELNSCKLSEAVFIGVGVKEQGKLKFKVHVIKTGIPLFNGWFTDSTLMVKNGLFTYYDSSGIEESEGVYLNNKEDGNWLIWAKGQLTDSLLYENGEEIVKTTFYYHDTDRLSKRVSNNAKSKTRELTEWYKDGTLKSTSVTVDSEGEWTQYYPNGRIEAVIRYSNGAVKDIKNYTESGVEMKPEQATKKTKAASNLVNAGMANGPSYPGGSAAFGSFFQRNFKPPRNYSAGAFPESVSVTFYLDKAGFAYDIRVEGASNRDLQTEIETVFRRMPAWNMNGFKSFGPITYNISL